jgi:hypothetical protein
MRSLILVVSILVLPVSGCSLFIANTGKDLTLIGSNEDAHIELGKPVASGTDKALEFEDFSYHSKVYREEEVGSASISLGMTFGLGEVILFPAALAHLGKALILGEKVRLYYDERGLVKMCRLNGEFLYGHGLCQPKPELNSRDLPPVVLDLMFTLIS